MGEYDWIVGIVKEWTVILAPVALVIATVYLGKQTKALVNQTQATSELTKATIKASEALQTMPSLTFDAVQPLSDSGGVHSRFSVKNVGYGHAKNPIATVRTNDGRIPQTHNHTPTNIIEMDNLYYWDVLGVNVGDVLNIEISFTDIRDIPYPKFRHTYTVI